MTTTDEQGWKGRPAESTQKLGPLLDQLRSLAKRVGNLESSSGLRSAAISQGGLTVKDGGNLDVRDGGAITAWSADDAGYTRMVGGRIECTYDAALETPGRLTAGLWGGRTSLFLTPPRTLGSTDPTRLILEGPSPTNEGGAWLQSQGQAVIRARVDVFVEATTGSANLKGAGAVGIESGGQVEIKSGTDLVFIDHQTTAAAANCHITTSGAIMRSTSSLRYKRDVEDAVIDPAAVLQLRPRTWRDRREVEANPTTTQRYIGLIAEELDALGLGQFVTYDADGPESISYDRIAVALIPVVCQQQDQLADLQRQVNELRALITPTPKETP